MSALDAVIFDLDGTLVESVADLQAAANALMAEHGLPAIDRPTVQGFVGNGVPKLVERCFAHHRADPGDLAAQVDRFGSLYETAGYPLTRLFDGVRPALERLAESGHPLGICTNKPEAASRAILAKLGIDGLLATVVGGDSLPVRKPDPAALRAAAAGCGVAAERTVYVGDSETDAETARAAGVPFALFTKGYRRNPVAALPHDAAFSDFGELPAIVRRLSADRAGSFPAAPRSAVPGGR